jgi:glucose 1-dehydrogenase
MPEALLDELSMIILFISMVVLFLLSIAMKLLGKIALVTGAARGIGRGCALELARAGADVVINDRDQTFQTEAIVAEIQALGRRAAVVNGSVFERPSCERIVDRAIRALGRINIFVSNPALQRRADFLDFDPETFAKVIEGTLAGGFHMSQLVARHMVERGSGGKIVFISSCHVHIPYARSVAYNAGKAGLNQMAFTIAAELYPHRINVNVIEPGWIDTPGEHEAFGDEVMARAGSALPWGRFGTPEDIGKAVAFLASDDADYITGVALRVDGGILLQHAHE